MNAIQPYAQALAKAESTHAEKAKEAAEALAGTDALRERLAAVAARREAVKAQLAADELDGRAAGGLLALADEDAADLQNLIAEAEARQTAAEAARDAAQNDLDRAREQLARAEAGERFGMLTKRAAELDQALCDCVARLAAEARASGRGSDLASAWKPSQKLSQALLLRAIPKMGQAA